MKIGILTFQPSLNYGGILQCLALKRTLEDMGHEVSVINRRHPALGNMLAGPYPTWGKRLWLRFAMRSLAGLDDFLTWLRYHRTRTFIKKHLNLTNCAITAWSDAPKDLGLDMVVVGSDQVWHCGDWGDPSLFLLENAPRIPVIAYSASFGMPELPRQITTGLFSCNDVPNRYKNGLARFRAISCRESEGVRICQDLGFSAAHVVDPTLLPELQTFHPPKRRLLVCYLMTISIAEVIAQAERLERFAKRIGCKVRLFIRDGNVQFIQRFPFPKNGSSTRKWICGLWRKATSPLSLELDAGPQEFLDAMSKAQWVVTDSFHGLMFSIRNNCNVRVLRPSNANRSTMFARIEEFSSHFEGSLFANGMDAALKSIECGERIAFDYTWLEHWRSESLAWLNNAVNAALCERNDANYGTQQ